MPLEASPGRPGLRSFLPFSGNATPARARTPYMPNTLYISDLDGTLLDNSARLADRCRGTLCELLADGLTFTVASARSVSSIATMLKGVPITLPVVEFNGAFLSDLATGRHEIVNGIDRAIVEDLHELLPRFNVAPFVSTFDG